MCFIGIILKTTGIFFENENMHANSSYIHMYTWIFCSSSLDSYTK